MNFSIHKDQITTHTGLQINLKLKKKKKKLHHK